MHQPTLYLLVGYPGSGKTTASRIIHQLTGAEHLWADHERSQMFSSPAHTRDENIQLYDELNRRARDLLRAGKSVIFDTNFNFYKDRKKLRVMAAKENARTVLVWVTTPKDVARERATAHSLEGEHHRVLGNMTVERFERIAGNLEPPSDAEQPVRLDGTSFDEASVARALNLNLPT